MMRHNEAKVVTIPLTSVGKQFALSSLGRHGAERLDATTCQRSVFPLKNIYPAFAHATPDIHSDFKVSPVLIVFPLFAEPFITGHLLENKLDQA